MKLAGIKTKWHLRKRRWADTLQNKFEQFSLFGKKLSLCFFCVVFAGSSIAVIIHAITTRQVHVVTAAKMPRIMQEKQTPGMPFISKTEFARIEKFRQYINQLPKPLSDSFMQARPHLLDSIAQIENYYQSQNKK